MHNVIFACYISLGLLNLYHAYLVGRRCDSQGQHTETHAPCVACNFSIVCSLAPSMGSTSASQRQVYPDPIHALRSTASKVQQCTGTIKHNVSPAPDSHEPQPGVTMKLPSRGAPCVRAHRRRRLFSRRRQSRTARGRPRSTHPCIRLRRQRTGSVQN